jgi:hypothetical protein
MQERPSLPAEHGGQPPPSTGSIEGSGQGLDDSRALPILSTEHWSLLATRSMLWNESFARAALFLSILSAAVVALSLIGTDRPDFRVFALVILPVVLFIGVATFFRIDDSNREEALWVIAMNRIRHGYVTMVPAVGDRFVTGFTDDQEGIWRSYGVPADAPYSILHFFTTMPGMISVIDGVLSGVVVAAALGPVGLPPIGLGAIAFGAGVGVALLLGLRSQRKFNEFRSQYEPRYPEAPPKVPLGPEG